METIIENIKKTMGGKELDVTMTRVIGRATYETFHGPVVADIMTTYDFGPRLGKTTMFSVYPNETPEESEKAKRDLSFLAGRIAAGY